MKRESLWWSLLRYMVLKKQGRGRNELIRNDSFKWATSK
jgi:hypothetical protein